MDNPLPIIYFVTQSFGGWLRGTEAITTDRREFSRRQERCAPSPFNLGHRRWATHAGKSYRLAAWLTPASARA